MKISRVLQAGRYLVLILLLSIPSLSLGELSDGHFDAPSSDNNLLYTVNNVGGSTLEGLRINHIEPIYDPANVLNYLGSAIIPGGTFDIEKDDRISFTLGPFTINPIITKQQCEDFQNPQLLAFFESQYPLAEGDTQRIIIPILPEGFKERRTGKSTQIGNCILVKVENCKCDVGSCKYNSEDKLYCGAAGDVSPPDDNEIIANAKLINFTNYNPSAPVGILSGGYAEDSMALLQKLQVQVRLVDGIEDLSPSLAAKMPVLVVPSNGFIAFEGLETFRRNLAGYVSAGGNVIVQAQGKDTYWAMLPGGVAAFGYSQDASCYRGGSVVNAYHEIISSENLLTSNVHMDGFFTTVPDDAVTVLARAKNGAAGLVVYPYGMGYVIAGHIYPDYAFYTGQYDPDELNYTRDMITWALRPAELPRFAPLATAELSFNLGYPTDQGYDEAAYARVEVMDPSRTGVFYGETVELTDPGLPGMLPGESVSVSLTLPALPNKLGLWHVMAQLYTADGLTIGERFEELNGRFAVTVLPAGSGQQISDIQVMLARDPDRPVIDPWQEFQITIFNDRPTPVTLTLQRDILHQYSREKLGVFEIQAGDSVSLVDGLTVLPTWPARYRYNLLYLEGDVEPAEDWLTDWWGWYGVSVTGSR